MRRKPSAVTVATVIAKEIFPCTDDYTLKTRFYREALKECIIQNIQQLRISQARKREHVRMTPVGIGRML